MSNEVLLRTITKQLMQETDALISFSCIFTKSGKIETSSFCDSENRHLISSMLRETANYLDKQEPEE